MPKKSLPFLSGQKVLLRPIEPEKDAANVTRWVNDPEVTYFMFYGQLPLSLAEAKKFLDTEGNSHHALTFIVSDKKTGREIGFAGLYEIDWISQRAEFRVLLGEKDFWSKGCGTEISELLTWFGFDRLNLHRIDLGVTSNNKGAIRAYEKAGYEYEFTRTDFMYRNSIWYDADFMVMFRDRYYKKFFKAHQKKFGVK
ncbi:MAG: GNAT family N-acetyltransferase [bacterium]|nr:GNAT family N-acetyltransferase [bacterium]